MAAHRTRTERIAWYWLATLCVMAILHATRQSVAFGDERAVLVGSERQLFLDASIVGNLRNAVIKHHSPIEREVVISHDEPWEGNVSCYHVVFRDGDRYRMYYRGAHVDDATGKQTSPDVCCYAESADGVRWIKPNLGLHEHEGSRQNNIVLTGVCAHNLAPFLDRNPQCRPEERYKAVAAEGKTLVAFKSSDGLKWLRLGDQPIIREGAFDSLNLAFWDERLRKYRVYFRDFRNGIRDVKTAVSDDFKTWSTPVWLDYGDAPAEHLYTNGIMPYVRAPQWLIGLPMRFVPGPNPQKHSIDGVSDALVMASRDGVRFQRRREAFIRPGPQADRWVNRNNLPAWGIIETYALGRPDSPELSMYATEGYYRGPAARLRRYAMRLDGFASVNAPSSGGEIITKPMIFGMDEGDDQISLQLNCATSAAGTVVVEVQDENGRPIAGFSQNECVPLIGDSLNASVVWSGGDNLRQLAGRPVRLRMMLNDADLYSFQFTGGAGK